jgi:hypothetical protein
MNEEMWPEMSTDVARQFSGTGGNTTDERKKDAMVKALRGAGKGDPGKGKGKMVSGWYVPPSNADRYGGSLTSLAGTVLKGMK